MTRAIRLALPALAVASSCLAQWGAPYARPDALIDLATPEGARLAAATWSYADAAIVDVEHRAPGHDLKASGAPVRARDIAPKPGDDAFAAALADIEPSALVARRGNGRLSFGWYRVQLTLPSRVGEIDTAGAAVHFQIVVDDYAEVWVDGRHVAALGQPGGSVVSGFNAPNRVLLTRDARPGQSFDIAVFAANAPLSRPPGNFVWVRSASLEFRADEPAAPGTAVETSILRLDPRLDAVVDPAARIEQIAGGFGFTEGPLWVADSGGSGALLFSDPNNNRIYRWDAGDGAVSVFRPNSGYAGADIARYRQPGSNGLALDPQGRLATCEHGNRRVTRTEPNGVVTVLAERFEGRRLNSPNDLVFRRDGALIFTDPYFGLPGLEADPAKELPFSGVYFLKDGVLRLLTDELRGPNGVALSPDERWLYVGNWDETRKVVMRYALSPDGAVSDGSVFLDLAAEPGEEAIDGVDVDRDGNVFVSGPGGVHVVAADGTRLGVLRGPELAANMAFGDADGRTLYLAARTGLYRLRLR